GAMVSQPGDREDMHFVDPIVIRLAQTEVNRAGVHFLRGAVGAPEFVTDAETGGEELIELAGRLCYRSFAPGLNPNVTKVREGNAAYMANLLKQQHYSVLEHVHVTYAFLNVSRVFTHELVRHRLSNFSQESLRYVRLDELGAYWPEAFGEEVFRKVLRQVTVEGELTEDQMAENVASMVRSSRLIFEDFFRHAEDAQTKFANLFGLDHLTDFNIKKRLTSAMRRCAPIGLTTAIIMTTNLRNWRHVIELRTGEHAEEEIRKVIGMVADDLRALYPNAMA
ncbi:MAG: FAD-dependent thymidylate synthase, partial [Gammaproteobacteria bacterium]